MKNQQILRQKSIFEVAENTYDQSKFISVYRIGLVKDESVPFEQKRLSNPQHAQKVIQSLIEAQGQPDREQFCVLLLNMKNKMIGLNIVSTGCLSSATVHPREVLKPAILANAGAMILSHNHPSGDMTPSAEDKSITKRIVIASKFLGINIHDHIIINMEDNRFFSFAEEGLISEAYEAVNLSEMCS